MHRRVGFGDQAERDCRHAGLIGKRALLSLHALEIRLTLSERALNRDEHGRVFCRREKGGEAVD